MKTLTEFSTLTLRKAAAARAAAGGGKASAGSAAEWPLPRWVTPRLQPRPRSLHRPSRSLHTAIRETPVRPRSLHTAMPAMRETPVCPPRVTPKPRATTASPSRCRRRPQPRPLPPRTTPPSRPWRRPSASSPIARAAAARGTRHHRQSDRSGSPRAGLSGREGSARLRSSRGEFHYVIDRVAGASRAPRMTEAAGVATAAGAVVAARGGGGGGGGGGGFGGLGGERGRKPRGLGSLKFTATRSPRIARTTTIVPGVARCRAPESAGSSRRRPATSAAATWARAGSRPWSRSGRSRWRSRPARSRPWSGRPRRRAWSGRSWPGRRSRCEAADLAAPVVAAGPGGRRPASRPRAQHVRPATAPGHATASRSAPRQPRLGPDGQPLPPRSKRRERKPIGPDANGMGPDGKPWDPERRAKRQAERDDHPGAAAGSPGSVSVPVSVPVSVNDAVTATVEGGAGDAGHTPSE